MTFYHSDFGEAFMEGIKGGEGECPQTLETRAPEVWKGFGAWPASDVWSVSITVLHLSLILLLPELTYPLACSLVNVQSNLWASRGNNQGLH